MQPIKICHTSHDALPKRCIMCDQTTIEEIWNHTKCYVMTEKGYWNVSLRTVREHMTPSFRLEFGELECSRASPIFFSFLFFLLLKIKGLLAERNYIISPSINLVINFFLSRWTELFFRFFLTIFPKTTAEY